MRPPGLDPEVLADLRRREASERDPNRTRRDPSAWSPPAIVERWRCRGGCGAFVEVTREAVDALATSNARLVAQRQEPISKHAVVWCPACKRRDDELAALQRGTRAPAAQQQPKQTELGIAEPFVSEDEDCYQRGVVVDTNRDECHHAIGLADAEHIAASDPVAVLALVARIRELEAEIREWIEIYEEDPREDPRDFMQCRQLLEKGAVMP